LLLTWFGGLLIACGKLMKRGLFLETAAKFEDFDEIAF
jgi:hypothetical protein